MSVTAEILLILTFFGGGVKSCSWNPQPLRWGCVWVFTNCSYVKWTNVIMTVVFCYIWSKERSFKDLSPKVSKKLIDFQRTQNFKSIIFTFIFWRQLFSCKHQFSSLFPHLHSICLSRLFSFNWLATFTSLHFLSILS